MKSTSIRIYNSGSHDFEPWLEPWGDFVRVAPGTGVRVEATAPELGELEIDWREDGATVYAWGTAYLRVFGANGAECKPGAFGGPGSGRGPAPRPGAGGG